MLFSFSTLGAWGPSAEETAKDLYADGPMWTSRTRRIAEKHNFICGISSTIKFTVARAWIKWLRGEGNRANTSPPSSEHSQDIHDSEDVDCLVGEMVAWVDETKFDGSDDENERDRNERESIVNSDVLRDAHSKNENNVAIDMAASDNSTENSDDGSETQSIIMDCSYNKDSLAVEFDSNCSL